MPHRVALVVGATGVVGRYLLMHFSRNGSPWDLIYAASRRPADIAPE